MMRNGVLPTITGIVKWTKKEKCVFLKSLDRFLLVKLIRLSNYTMPY